MLKKELEVLERKIKAAERKVDSLYNDYNNALVEVMQFNAAKNEINAYLDNIKE